MRPMKFGGEELLYGTDVLEHLSTLSGERAIIVIGSGSIERSGYLKKVMDALRQGGFSVTVFRGVEPDPCFETVLRGVAAMRDFCPDWIIALGGGSAMDAAKAMWVVYENPELDSLEKFSARHNNMPPVRKKARMAAIPSTSGTASEVSRSVVISDKATGKKAGASDMKIIPDLVLLDPNTTVSMPPSVTAETGMDALTHSIEAITSTRANLLSDTLAVKAFQLIMENLPMAWKDGKNLEVREKMLLASCMAGMAFTNVSLGIVHSMAHVLGSIFGIAHGMADAILLPHIVRFNSRNPQTKKRYDELASVVNANDLPVSLDKLNHDMNIPCYFETLINDEYLYMSKVNEMAEAALSDGCTKTNPIIPTVKEMKDLFISAYKAVPDGA